MGWFENLIGKVCDYFVSYSPKYQTIQEEQKRLRASLESSEKERRELRTSLKSSADVVAELKSEISAEKNENGRLKNKLFEYAGQDAELDIARRQILGDIVNGVVYRRTISEQGERIGKLEESLSGQEEQIGEMRSTLSSQNDKIGELERFASDLVQKNKDTERQVELQMGNVAYLKGQLRDYFVETLPAILDSSSLGNRKLLLVRKDGKIYYSSRRVRSILGESNQIIFEKESNRGDVE
jgi:chromosome segregation ATPase